ncbi:PI-actitoxin-Axm2b-like [Dendropsophus ebraccatus]|uniref:PI-actitoxin-Axm2b-like n=1 Tax=Dendropsophus ebraccatus TaxID=150705 RepID=UPI0038314047
MKTSAVLLVLAACFLLLSQAEQEPRCLMSRSPGIGKKTFTEYYYDSATNTCKSAQFKGTSRVGNRFYSKKQCEEACMKEGGAETSE